MMMITETAYTYLTMGTLLGLTAGLSPGPMLTLVISHTLQHNKHEGAKIAFAPLITDLPVILVTYFVFSKIAHFNLILGVISLLGGMYVSRLAYHTFRSQALTTDIAVNAPGSFKKGILTSVLNPNPWFFWLTVGIPIVFKAYAISLLTAILFFVSFYTLLIGSVIGVAWLVEHTRAFLKTNVYTWVMRVLGMALLVFALIFFYDGLKTLMRV